MDRRQFFKNGLDKVKKAVTHAADVRAKSKATHWIRPPFALDEVEFLLTCTRCDECIDACPHDVIFGLPISRGAVVAGTPALNLLNQGCHLCENWPCVNICETGALIFPVQPESQDQLELQDQALVAPQISVAVIETDQCLPYLGPECGVCKDSCPLDGALIFEGVRPTINPEVCVGCGLCREVCIANPKAIGISSLQK